MKPTTFMSTLLLSMISLSSHATIDSYTTMLYPMAKSQAEGYCMVESIVHDGVSNMGTKYMIAYKALENPFVIPGFQAGEDKFGLIRNVNQLHAVGIEFHAKYDDEMLLPYEMTINSSKATAKAKTRSDREMVIEKVKLAIYSAVTNTIDKQVKTLKISLVGLPDQSDLSQKIPLVFNYNFNLTSPFLLKIKNDLNIKHGVKGCNSF